MASNLPNSANQSLINNTPYFVGFSTVDQLRPPFSLTDIDLVKRDLNNQFATPMGSRLMLPNFGTNIYSYLFDPFDDYTKNSIIQDAVRIVQSDPRVELVSIDTFQENQALNIVMALSFQPQNVTESLFVSFSLQDQNSF